MCFIKKYLVFFFNPFFNHYHLTQSQIDLRDSEMIHIHLNITL